MSNPKTNFVNALNVLRSRSVTINTASSLWHSPAWPAGQGYPDYVNAVVNVSTPLSATELLGLLHKVESQFGRKRNIVNAPRTLDLDIIDYKGIEKNGEVNLPHPRAMNRPFVLLPMLEIAPEWAHPTTRLSALNGLARLSSEDVLSHHVIERKWLKSVACV